MLKLTHKAPYTKTDPCDGGELEHEVNIYQHGGGRDKGNAGSHVGQALGVLRLLNDDEDQERDDQQQQHQQQHGPPLAISDLTWPEDDEGAEAEYDDEEQHDAAGDDAASGQSGPVHLARQAETNAHGVIARAQQLLQLQQVRAICLVWLDAWGHVHCAVVGVTGGVGGLVGFTDQHLVVS